MKHLLPRSKAARLTFLTLAPCIAGYALLALSQQISSNPNTANVVETALAADPLYAQGAGQKPTLTLALSVEFPTVGAAYRDNYAQSTTYVGYFDSESCYRYNKTDNYFERYGASTNHGCAGAGFSGNFMNWASTSAIDILRLGLTGGDRITDDASLTVLQRAVIRTDFYNSGNYFPAKTLPSASVNNAVPTALKTKNDGSTHTGDIKIANCLNRIHFGTESAGNCTTPGNNANLGVGYADGRIGDIVKNQINTRIDLTQYQTAICADGSNCSFTGIRKVYFGRQESGRNGNAYWHWAYVKNTFNCNWHETSMGDPSPGTTKSCYVSNASYDHLFPESGLSNNAYFFTRAKVCDFSGSTLNDPRGTTYCQRYPNGGYKPVGNMQRYSDRIRLAAFGYLMEDGNARYGGVLRAPMTYVGPRAYDANGNAISGTNTFQEWDPNTGIFISNPRGATDEANSGVINYLNKFGRTAGYEGIYKSNDPVGELYYESLRYLQGLQPTAAAVSNIDSAKRAGFPAYSTWTDPFDGGSANNNYACLRNSILLIGDVNTHNDKSLPGNDRTTGEGDTNRTAEVNLSNNIPDFKEWTRVVGGFESGNAVNYTDGDGRNRTTSNPSSSPNTARWGMENQNTGSSNAAYYMAGAAYWAHTHDIRGSQWSVAAKRRPGMRVTTYVIDVNENNNQNNNNNRWNSQFFLTAKYGGFSDLDGDGNPFTPATTDDALGTKYWAKDTAPTEAKTYFLASDANAMLKALDDIFVAATQVSSSIAKPALSSSRLTTSDSYVYQADFDPEYWSGDVKRRALRVSSSGGVELSDETDALSAAKVLDARTNADMANRKIFVGKTSGTSSGYATAFTWSTIESALQTALNKATPTATADSNGQLRLSFLRGDRSLEATTFRKRASRLGDIVNSGITYSGAPTTRYADTAYKTFYTNNLARTKAVFVGANDGMLHAFNADTLEELFAYIPSWMGTKLSTLTTSDYNSSRHTSYVDATPVVAEAQVGSNWKTVLVSGTGGGGQGVFALDVTDPSQFSASSVMWEFTDADDASLGNVVGQPKILKLRTSAPNASTITYKWFAVIASGVNNYQEDGTGRFSTTGEPALFLLDLAKPTSTSWALGTNYFKITLPLIKTTDSGTQLVANGTVVKPSGLINFDAIGNADGSVQFFYFGDLHGQFWKLDMNAANLSSSTASAWSLNTLSYYKSSGTARPMYIAKSSDGKVQPISMTPSLAYGPQGAYIISFGTGKYLEATDNAISGSQTQSFYVLYDLPDQQLDTKGTARFNGRERLQQGTVSGSTVSTTSFFWVAPRDATTTGTNKKAGWFIDFPYSGDRGGERQITNAVLFGKQILFNSLLPPTASGSACGGGSSYSYAADLASGAGSVSGLSEGALGAPILLKLGSDLSAASTTGGRFKTENVGVLNPSAKGLSNISTQSATYPVGRLSWRQINNYQDLKNKSW